MTVWCSSSLILSRVVILSEVTTDDSCVANSDTYLCRGIVLGLMLVMVLD